MCPGLCPPIYIETRPSRQRALCTSSCARSCSRATSWRWAVPGQVRFMPSRVTPSALDFQSDRRSATTSRPGHTGRWILLQLNPGRPLYHPLKLRGSHPRPGRRHRRISLALVLPRGKLPRPPIARRAHAAGSTRVGHLYRRGVLLRLSNHTDRARPVPRAYPPIATPATSHAEAISTERPYRSRFRRPAVIVSGVGYAGVIIVTH